MHHFHPLPVQQPPFLVCFPIFRAVVLRKEIPRMDPSDDPDLNQRPHCNARSAESEFRPIFYQQKKSAEDISG